MFDKALVLSKAKGLVGFNKSTHQFYKHAYNHKDSTSGYWVNALPGADFFTIEATLPTRIQNVNLTIGEKYKIMAEGGSFASAGAVDNDIGTVFVAKGTLSGYPTAWEDGAWLELQSCNDYLQGVFDEEMINLVSRFIKNSNGYLRQNTLLSNHSVIGGVADMSKTVTKNGRFVGFVLNPLDSNNIVNTITKLGFLGDAADSGLKLYLYETSQDTAIATFEFDYTTALSQQWKDVSDFIVRYDNTQRTANVQTLSLTTYSNSGGVTLTQNVEEEITFATPFTDLDYDLDISNIYGIPGIVSNRYEPYEITEKSTTGFKILSAYPISLTWTAVKKVDTLTDANTYSGGIGQKYLLGYFEDDLTCNAIEMEFNQSLKNFSVFGKYMSIYPVAIPSSKLDGYNLPSSMLDLGNYITENTHGLYFKFTANCDYTNLITDNIDQFAEALQYAIAIRILEDAVASVGNGVHNSTKDSAIPEWRSLIAKYSGILNGGYISIGQNESVYKKGLIELLTLDFSGIDNVCMKKDYSHEYNIGNLV